MLIQKFLAIAIIGDQCNIAGASWPKIAGYNPGSKVTSHNAIDLDQKALEDALSQAVIDYPLVKNIYEQGGNSKTYAEFSVPALSTALRKGDQVVGLTSGVVGKMYANYAVGDTAIRVAYPTAESQATYVNCKGGALVAAPAGTTATAMMPYILATACFQNEQLNITTAGANVMIQPSGNPTNKAGRTLQGFSTKAGGTMYTQGSNGGCAGASDRATDGCPYVDFGTHYAYYGDFDYANKLVLAAINAGSTSFTTPTGQMDFTGKPDSMRKEIIKKGTAYMNAYMYAIREFEDAIDDCKAGCPGGQSVIVSGRDCNGLSLSAVHAWDEGVAFYTGSLEGAAVGGSSAGKLSYRLAEKRCANFKTCGPSGDSVTGVSFVNTKLFQHLDIGKTNLLAGRCEETRPVLREMVALMSVPLIQGTLRYAYKVDKLSGGDKEKGEGAVFAAAIVPRVASCSSVDAATIMNNMKIGASSTSFAAVKTAFERNYACMNITCVQIGGLWYGANNSYYDSAEPCASPLSPTPTASPSPSPSRKGVGPATASQCAPHTGVLSVANLIILFTMILRYFGQ